MNKKIRIGIIAGIVAAAATAVVWVGTHSVKSISAEIKDTAIVYEFEDITKSDLDVYAHPWIGGKQKIQDYTITNAVSNSPTISYKTFNTEVHTDRVRCVDIKASYNAKAYEGQSLSKSAVTLEMVYADGLSYAIKEFSVPGNIVFGKQPEHIVVTSEYGNADVVITPILIRGIEADYKYALHINEEFNKENVSVTVVYEDGTKLPMKSFSCDFEGPIKEETDIPIKTVYGEIPLHINPVPVKELKAVCSKPIYESEKLTKDNIFITAVMEDGTEVTVDEFETDYIDKAIMEETDVPITTKYGNTTLHITPIPIVYATTDAGTVEVNSEIVIHTIIFQFEDGATMEIDARDVEFLDDPSEVQFVEGDNLFEFIWQQKKYTLTIPAVYGYFAGYSM